VSIISLTFLLARISGKTANSLIPIVITHFSFNASLNLLPSFKTISFISSTRRVKCYSILIIRLRFQQKEFRMTVEQVARDFVSHMNDAEKMKTMVTADAMASGGVLPQPIPVMEAMQMMNGLTTAFPDLKFDVQQVTVNGNQATVKAVWSGKNTGPLSLPMPGMPTIPATGKMVSVKDTYILTVQGDKVSHMKVDSPADGGIPAALAQLGVKAPSL
jgi:predicted ester cyclase